MYKVVYCLVFLCPRGELVNKIHRSKQLCAPRGHTDTPRNTPPAVVGVPYPEF